jgi:hypothetical protein
MTAWSKHTNNHAGAVENPRANPRLLQQASFNSILTWPYEMYVLCMSDLLAHEEALLLILIAQLSKPLNNSPAIWNSIQDRFCRSPVGVARQK